MLGGNEAPEQGGGRAAAAQGGGAAGAAGVEGGSAAALAGAAPPRGPWLLRRLSSLVRPRRASGSAEPAPAVNWGKHYVVQVGPGLLCLTGSAQRYLGAVYARDAAGLCGPAAAPGGPAAGADGRAARAPPPKLRAVDSAIFEVVARGVNKGIGKSAQEVALFSFGFDARRRALPGVEAVFSAAAHHDCRKSEHAQTGVLSTHECFREARGVLTWLESGAAGAPRGRAALVLASGEAHLRLVLTAARLLSQPRPASREAAIAEAHRLFAEAAAPKGRLLTASLPWLLRRKSAPEAASAAASAAGAASPPAPAPAPASAGAVRKASTSTALRTVTGLGELRWLAPERAAEPMLWRKMVMRKIVLSHAPRVRDRPPVSVSHEAAGTSRPYVMVTNGDQNDFLYSTMVQGIRSCTYAAGQEVSFDVNCRVDGDVVLKLYHMEPGEAGELLLKLHLNVGSAEPVLLPPPDDGGPQLGEALVAVTVPIEAVDAVPQPAFFDGDFRLQIVLGMPAELARLSAVPRCFASAEAARGHSQLDGKAVPALRDYLAPQIKCVNPPCARLFELGNSDEAACPGCGLVSRPARAVVKLAREAAARRSAAVGKPGREQERDAETAEHDTGTEPEEKDHELVEEADLGAAPPSHPPPEATAADLSYPVPPPPPPPPLPGVGASVSASAGASASASARASASASGFSAEAALRACLDDVCMVLPFMTRERAREDLGRALSICSNSAEADAVVQTFVAQAFGDDALLEDLPAMPVSHSSPGSVGVGVGVGVGDGVSVSSTGSGGAGGSAGGAPARIRAGSGAALRGSPTYSTLLDLGLLSQLSDEDRMELLAGLVQLNLHDTMLELARHDGSHARAPPGPPRVHYLPFRARRGYGLGNTELSRLPVHVFRAGASGGEQTCCICLLDFEEGDECRNLPCFHSFHATCVDRWLVDKSTCPVCTREVSSAE
jgi:hypothetical protein